LDIICVDTPSGEVAEKSSSYDLSMFSSGANSQGAEIVAVASRGSSSSIRELWPNIDMLDEIWHRDTSFVHTHDVSVRGRRPRHEGKIALLKDVPGTPNAKSKGRRGSSAKNGSYANLVCYSRSSFSTHVEVICGKTILTFDRYGSK
jgi:hypothetical protein